MKSIILLTLLISSVYAWDYLLFVQYSPGSWCQSKDQCNQTYDYWGIHGIWPEDFNSSYPEYCQGEKFDLKNVTSILPELEKYWTNFENATKFWEHEYNKHGTCARQDKIYFPNELTFFQTGLALREVYNVYSALKNENIVPGNQYQNTTIYNALLKQFNFRTPIYCVEKNGKPVLDHIISCFSKEIEPMNCPLNLQTECPHYLNYLG